MVDKNKKTLQRTLTRTGSVSVTGRMEIEKAQIIDRLAAEAGMTRSEYVRYQLNLIIAEREFMDLT